MGAADGLRFAFTNADSAHLALFDQLRHGADGLFDRHLGVDAVLEI